MRRDQPRTPALMDLLLRGLRIGASTIAIVELLRSDWIGGGLSSLAWLVFVLVERRRAQAAAQAESCIRSVRRLKNRIDAVGMLTDVGIEFHRQEPRFKCIIGVKAGFQLFAVGVSVANGVGSQSLVDCGHEQGTSTDTT